jgi:hypothetical protein
MNSNRIIALSFRPFLFNRLGIQTKRRCRSVAPVTDPGSLLNIGHVISVALEDNAIITPILDVMLSLLLRLLLRSLLPRLRHGGTGWPAYP